MNTFDTMAARILLTETSPARRQALLRKGAEQARQAIGEQCPECFSESTEDNGHTGRHVEFRCVACDHRWGPGAEA